MKDRLIINRSKWKTGEILGNFTGKGDTELLNEEGFMCCLGFCCHQMGISKKELLNKSIPSELVNWEIPGLLDKRGNDSKFANDALGINDDPKLSIKKREKKIKKHFAKENIIVKFKGKYKHVNQSN